jgi:malonyl-CoA O-methyltransferase
MHRSVKIPAKKRISQSFGLKASKYDQHAQVQKRYQDYLKLQITKESQNGLWADLGCGNGRLLADLENVSNQSTFIGIDIAYQSLLYQKKNIPSIQMIQGDIENLPLKSSSLSGIIISSVLQWIYDLDSFFFQISKILKQNGKFYFSIFTIGSFKELTEVRNRVGLPDPISLPDAERIRTALIRNSFKEISLKEDEEIVYFPSARELLKSLSAIGSTAIAEKPMTRNQLHAFCQTLESMYRTEKGVPLTYRSALGWAINKAEF